MSTDKRDVLYGNLGLMVLKTLEALGPLHGYRIARRIEQISGDQLAMNQGTLYPALLELQQRRVERPLIHRELIAADLLDPAGDPVAVKGPQGLQRLEHHQAQVSV